jgi:hypothetical protein
MPAAQICCVKNLRFKDFSHFSPFLFLFTCQQ